jgi:GntR family transcriptional regulator
MTGDSEPGRALYLRIADELRRLIASGDLPEGARIESESELGRRWNASRLTVRQAVEVLRAEGLVIKQHGRGTFVRRRPALETRSSTRYRRQLAAETSPFARDARREGAEPDWSWETQRIRADEPTAVRLGLAPGDHVMRTAYLFRADGRPVQTSVSWEPFALVGGTAIEEPEGTGGPVGVIARMDAIGVRVDRVTERVRSRPATEAERRDLEIADGVWVMTVERTHWAGDRAAETADITIPADRYVLAYEIPVP